MPIGRAGQITIGAALQPIATQGRAVRATVFLENLKSLRDSPVGAGKPAKQATRSLAPALPVFAGMPAPTGPALAWSCRRTCRSNCLSQNLKSLRDSPVGAGKPAKQATRCLAPAAPVFAGMPAPTGVCAGLELPPYLQEQLSFSKFEKPTQ
ncbi:hypothetical protein EGJ15_00935 [Pseudomonas sp. p99-361]|nr:hypothetical protein EGJ15_00935 [Pseudomonas sp. p99-361]